MSLFDQVDPQEQAIAEMELNEWIDSQPVPQPPIQPTCGHCIYFNSRGIDIDGIQGVCQLRTEIEYHPTGVFHVYLSRESTDEICHRFTDKEAVPF
jgi:hypothetical protein